MADEILDRRICSINGQVLNWHLGKAKFSRSMIEKIHCMDMFVYDATNNPKENIGGKIKASLRVAEKYSWYLAEQESRRLGITNEEEIEKVRARVLFEKFGISDDWLAERGWRTTEKKIVRRMEQALARKEYIEGEWRGIANGTGMFEIFVDYKDFTNTDYNPYILLSGVLAKSNYFESIKWVKNPETKKWAKAKVIEDYSKYTGEAYFVNVLGSEGKFIFRPQSLGEVVRIATTDRNALHLENEGTCSFDVNYTYATPIFIK